MISGIGVDIISITRIKNAVENSGKVFLDEVYTEWEQQRANSHSDPLAYFAMTFAAKEAIFKCFSIGWESGVKFTEIEVTEGEFGEPVPILRGRFAELANERGITKVLLSLSYDTEYAVGTANLIGSKE
jgi:phosphopantetheine--protein transferase-like protein